MKNNPTLLNTNLWDHPLTQHLVRECLLNRQSCCWGQCGNTSKRKTCQVGFMNSQHSLLRISSPLVRQDNTRSSTTCCPLPCVCMLGKVISERREYVHESTSLFFCWWWWFLKNYKWMKLVLKTGYQKPEMLVFFNDGMGGLVILYTSDSPGQHSTICCHLKRIQGVPILKPLPLSGVIAYFSTVNLLFAALKGRKGRKACNLETGEVHNEWCWAPPFALYHSVETSSPWILIMSSTSVITHLPGSSALEHRISFVMVRRIASHIRKRSL